MFIKQLSVKYEISIITKRHKSEEVSSVDFDIYTRRISRYLEIEYIGKYKSRRTKIYINRRFFGRIKKEVWKR